jgi:hypothetical protein
MRGRLNGCHDADLTVHACVIGPAFRRAVDAELLKGFSMAKFKPKKNAREEVLKIRNRVNDLMKYSAEDVQRGQFMKMTGHIVLEMKYLLDLVEFAAKSDESLFQKFAATQDVEPVAEDADLGESGA